MNDLKEDSRNWKDERKRSRSQCMNLLLVVKIYAYIFVK